MKKSILILLFFICSFSGFSQTTPWISSGATWHYEWGGVGQGGYDKIEYIQDSVILGKTCEVLKTTRYTFIGPPTMLISTTSWKNYTYSSGDTVFYLLDTAFEVLYNFSAAAGDTWDLGLDSADYCSKSITVVDSISTYTIASVPHRRLYVSDSADSSIGIEGQIIEHIGSMDYLFPLGRFCGSGVVDYYDFHFSCFSDSLESYLLVPADECANPFHVGISEQGLVDEKLEIFPNPAKNEINFSAKEIENYSLFVFNTFGQVILSKETNSQTQSINIENLSPGIYFLRLKSANGKIKNGIFVKQ